MLSTQDSAAMFTHHLQIPGFNSNTSYSGLHILTYVGELLKVKFHSLWFYGKWFLLEVGGLLVLAYSNSKPTTV